ENPNQPNNDKPTKNPEPKPPIDTENWWLGEEEIDYAYSEMRKELGNSPEIQLVSPKQVRSIQEGGEISEELKKADYIFFPISSSSQSETTGNGTHWSLLVYSKEREVFYLYDPLKGFNERYQRQQINEQKLAEKVRKELYEKESHTIVEDGQNNARQENSSDCGVFVIAYTRTLTKRIKEKGNMNEIAVRETDLIFSIAEERQKLKAAGFPKKY
ncbi:MAG: hypothetical protein I3273_07765, partial [Candidatus Moeniiplasma glomeromycotorum]|nr:hypothetical protein [Candidatus Moeniiplasma glomeromycotorum]